MTKSMFVTIFSVMWYHKLVGEITLLKEITSHKECEQIIYFTTFTLQFKVDYINTCLLKLI